MSEFPLQKHIRIGVTGPAGRLGSTLVDLGCIPIRANITSFDDLLQAVQKQPLDIIVHAAAYTDVDKAEEEPETAFLVNARGTANVRDSFFGPVVYVSTDYVFDGISGPYTEAAEPNPLGWYGHSKLAGESMLAISDVIVRTTALYGNPRRDDFVKRILAQYRSGKHFSVTDEVSGNPTHVYMLAQGIIRICSLIVEKKEYPRIINIAGRDVCTRYQFARIVGEVFHQNVELCQVGEIHIKGAARPRLGGLAVHLADSLGIPLGGIKAGLKKYREALR